MLPLRNRYSFRLGVPCSIIQSPLFVLRYQQNTIAQSRFSIVVSKKVAVHATDRNRLKRIVSEALLRIIKENAVTIDGVFYMRRPATELTVEQAYQEVGKLLAKHGIIQL